ncbi:SDR family NAD(P)-dependent oxidoreductase [Pacificispira sp.]|uniref:SDR family NAD(P)-dependent oxidoreductase n=1 Tax=Pacificispira sp. TaxID=2888761 RepID=UPI003B517493
MGSDQITEQGHSMMFEENAVAVVSGGGSGLGAATARALAKAGCRVSVFDIDADRGGQVAREIDGYFHKVDVTDPVSVAGGFAASRSQWGMERITVCCAGIAPGQKTVSKGLPHDPALFRKTLEVNLMGTFYFASQSAAGMVTLPPIGPDNVRGVIAMTASVAAFEGQIGQVAYAASKAAVAGMTLPMARDLSRDGIRVCTVAPGIFKTPMIAGLPEDMQQSLGSQVPYPSRLGDPAEFASLVLEIIRNPMLNGEVIRLDGAIRLAPR